MAQAPEEKIDTKEWERRWDSLYNTLSGIGSGSDKDRATAIGCSRSFTSSELAYLYRDSDYAAKIVEELPKDSTRNGWEVVVEGEESDPVAEDMNRLGLRSKLRQADIWSWLYGGSLVVMGIDDGAEDPSEPVNMERVRGITSLVVADRFEAWPEEYFSDFTDPRYGEVKIYSFQQRSTPGVASQNVPTRIHADRVLRFDGVPLPKDLSSENNGWGDSKYHRCFNKLQRLEMSEAAFGTIVQEFGLGMWKVEGLHDILSGPDGLETFMKRLMAVNAAKSTVRAFCVDADNEDYQKLANKISGAAQVYDRIAQGLASAADMPMTKLYGQSPGGLSTDDNSGRQNWYGQVKDSQTERYEPHIRRVTDLLLAADGQADVEFTVQFHPLYEPTQEEKADARNTQAKTDQVYIQEGVLMPEEVRSNRFEGPEYSFETRVDPDEAPIVPNNEE